MIQLNFYSVFYFLLVYFGLLLRFCFSLVVFLAVCFSVCLCFCFMSISVCLCFCVCFCQSLSIWGVFFTWFVVLCLSLFVFSFFLFLSVFCLFLSVLVLSLSISSVHVSVYLRFCLTCHDLMTKCRRSVFAKPSWPLFLNSLFDVF